MEKKKAEATHHFLMKKTLVEERQTLLERGKLAERIAGVGVFSFS